MQQGYAITAVCPEGDGWVNLSFSLNYPVLRVVNYA